MITHLLTIGVEYTGHNHIYGCAIRSADLFEHCISSKINLECKISLRGYEANLNKITDTILKLMQEDDGKLIIYYAGHGNHIGNLEHWQTNSGNLNQVKLANLLNKSKGIETIVISESCSSEHMINAQVIRKDYMYYGATQDYEDALISSDGGIFTLELVSIIDRLWNKDRNFTHKEVIEELEKSQFDCSHFSVRYSKNSITENSFFH